MREPIEFVMDSADLLGFFPLELIKSCKKENMVDDNVAFSIERTKHQTHPIVYKPVALSYVFHYR